MGILSKILLTGTGLALGGTIVSLKTGNPAFYEHIFMPAVKFIPPEESHKLAVLGFRFKLFGTGKTVEPENLNLKLLGLDLSNPVGLAAGFDKNAEAVEGLFQVGFGFVEVGSITPQPQPGNEKPRVFRLLEDQGIINRYGFNSDGIDSVQERLKKLRANDAFKGVVGINLGKNKTSDNPVGDYKTGIAALGPYGDYLVINISSPNTPGLRSMQNKKELENLLRAAVEERNKLEKRVPLVLKISPDLNESELKDIANVIQKKDTKMDALIISNTTTSRPESLQSGESQQVGGLSGAPIKDLSTKVISHMWKLTKGSVPIIGVGGIATGQDAYEKILAGASAVQVYSAMVFEGPPVVNRIKEELSALLESNNYKSVQDAVGKAPKK